MSNLLPSEYQRIRQHLQEIRKPLLNLHKALVDSERVSYEKTIGQIVSPNHFLQLLTDDPWFAWLHPLSELIVAIDEALDAKTPPEQAVLLALVQRAYDLLAASETASETANHGFAKHYFEALQRDPDVVVAHAEVAKFRRSRPSPG